MAWKDSNELSPDPEIEDSSLWEITTTSGTAKVLGGIKLTNFLGTVQIPTMALPSIGDRFTFTIKITTANPVSGCTIGYGAASNLWNQAQGMGTFVGIATADSERPLTVSGNGTGSVAIDSISIVRESGYSTWTEL